MPVFFSGPCQAPAWSELERFDIVRLNPGESYSFERIGVKEKLIVGAGACRVALDGSAGHCVETRANLDLTSGDGMFRVTDVSDATTLIHLAGRWGDELGGSGIFTCANVDHRSDGGDPVAYPKTTNFDSHFHDCDEFWILFEGWAEVVSEGQHYNVGPGDCVATGMGHHHDVAVVREPICAVYLETTMQGQERRGHLWDHKHGSAEPQPERS